MRFRIIIFFIPLLFHNLLAQDITFIPRQTSVSDTIGKEIILVIDLVNISQTEQTVFIVRTLNQIPQGWTTSLCFDYCYPDWVDSIATTSTFGSTPLQPGESREVSVHFFTNNSPNSGMVQIQAGTFRNSDQRITVELNASTFDPTSVVNEINPLNEFKLVQNYPNPFNPETKIAFVIGNYSFVSLNVFDIMGNLVAKLLGEEKQPGKYEINFDANEFNLSSGIYFYRLTAGNFTQTKAMLLEK